MREEIMFIVVQEEKNASVKNGDVHKISNQNAAAKDDLVNPAMEKKNT